MLRVLFTEPHRAWQVQQLARQARVSLGLAFKVKQRLRDPEYAREAEEGIQLARPEDLLRHWAAAGRSGAYVDADPAAVAGGLGWKPVPSGAHVTLIGAPDEGVWV